MFFGFSDSIYKINHSASEARQIIEILQKNNIKDIRYGLNISSLQCYNPFGDINFLLPTFKMASGLGMNIHIYLFLSDDIANAGQGRCPKKWEKYSLNDISSLIADDCRNIIRLFDDNDINISSYTIGNESEWGVCGFRINDRVSPNPNGSDNSDDFEWLRNHLWRPTMIIIKESAETIKTLKPDCDICIHSDSVTKNKFTYEFFKYMCENIEFDKIALSYNPWTIWDKDHHLCKLERTLNDLLKLNKPISFVEYSYPWKVAQLEEFNNIVTDERYDYSICGQSNFHVDFIEFCKNKGIDSIFFWRGEHERETDISDFVGIIHNGDIDGKLKEKIQNVCTIQTEN